MSRFLEGGVKFLRIQWHILDHFKSHHGVCPNLRFSGERVRRGRARSLRVMIIMIRTHLAQG